jgi:hypothetical protein
VGCGAGLHADQARWQRLEKGQHLTAPESWTGSSAASSRGIRATGLSTSPRRSCGTCSQSWNLIGLNAATF